MWKGGGKQMAVWGTEDGFIEFCEGVVEAGDDADWSEVARAIGEACEAWPGSSEVMCAAAEVAVFAAGHGAEIPFDAVELYRRAIDASPVMVEAWEGLGAALDVLRGDAAGARDAFERAIELGAGPDGYAGLARLMAEAGDREAAVALLEGCPWLGDERVARMREEIAGGDWDPVR